MRTASCRAHSARYDAVLRTPEHLDKLSHDLQLAIQRAGIPLTSGGVGLSFERDIKPLFSDDARTRINWKFDLWDYESVKANISEILKRMENSDSPFEEGWTEDRAKVFRSWLREGLMAP